MQQYQRANQPEKTVAVGRKVIALDKDNTIAQVLIASTIAETVSETAPEHDAQFSEAMKDADAAVKGMDANLATANMTPEQASALKSALLATAHSAMGEIESKKQNWPAAEEHFKAAVASNTKADPTTLMRLAIAQDHETKYNDALDSINKAITAADAQGNGLVAAAARKHKLRLTQLLAQSPKKPVKKK